MSDFVHLHLHTEWSLLDGAIRIDDLVQRLLDYKMSSCAITDHGTLFGIINFYTKLKKADLKPILGCEFYVAEGSRFTKKATKRGDGVSNHLILLAKNEEGYRNLVKLGSLAYLEGFYYRPRIDKELLMKYRGGLIALSACLEGEIPQLILQGNPDKALEVARWYKELFGQDFYLEIQKNGIPEQDKVNSILLEIGEKLKIKAVATADCHYLDREDAFAHEVLLCIQTGHRLSDPDRFKFNTKDLYLADPEEMKRRFADLPSELLSNTLEIMEKVSLQLKLGSPLFPKAKVPEGEDEVSYFIKKAKRGLEERLKELKSRGELFDSEEEYWKRLEMELEVIAEKGYAGYFLIVSDFCQWAKRQGIPVGPGRGSAAGALTSYALGITDLDPIRFGLLFERFLNRERPSLPDIDVDFCMEGRDKVIEYVGKTYGEDHLAKIATFGQLKARQVLRDVGRALGFKPKEIDPIAKMITPGPDVSLADELKRPEIQEILKQSPKIKELFELALKLERLPRHASQHAAGVIISPCPLDEITPIMRGEEGEKVVQLDMKACETLGLIKFDFLGLKTLTIIDITCKALREHEGIELDLSRIPLDDERTFALLQEGETDGVFQLESEGMKELLKRLKPTDFNDLIAVLALYRPGPLKGGLVDQYIDTKHGRRKAEYLHPLLEPILKETYGVIVYQEQVMEIARAFAGYTLGEADLLRRAMGKKDRELMQKLKEDFVERSVRRNIPKDIAEKVFDLMEKFADYGFNKSHSAAYALISYQTAYLKAHYPVYFLASILTYEINKSEEVSKYLSLAHKMGIDILPPDINSSSAKFTVEEGAIRIGLQAVKNVGEEAVQEIMRKKPFKNFIEFCQKIDTQKVNRKTIEALIKAGAFDSIEENRAKLLINLPKILSFTQETKGASLFGQNSLLSLSIASTIKLEETPPWSAEEKLAFEKEALGFYLSDHPLRKYRPILNIFTPYNLENIENAKAGEKIILPALISDIKLKTTKNGNKMAILKLEDEYSTIKALLFPDLYKEHLSLIKDSHPLWFKGELDAEDENMTFIIEDLTSFDDLRFFKEGIFTLLLPHEQVDEKLLKKLGDFMDKEMDDALPVRLILQYPDAVVTFETNGYRLPSNLTLLELFVDTFNTIKLRYSER
ncbi:MAG: DNA polymerase III subunit alpha [Caldimicrobium sp.]|nr:DNA polymerase III subunit alpha [Caldimicrobium sp.]